MAWAAALTLAVAGVTFLLGFNDGTYQLTDRSAVAIAAWWAMAIGIALKAWPRERTCRTRRSWRPARWRRSAC